MSLIVSVHATRFDELAQRATAAAPNADGIELRLDDLPDVSERDLGSLIARLERPVIAAVHGPEGYGRFAGEPSARRELLWRAARAGARFVDVDERFAADFGAPPGETRRIVSRHDKRFDSHAPSAWPRLRALASTGDLCKWIVEVERAEEGLEHLRRLEGARDDAILFAAGTAGAFTRAIAPALGSRFTYAAADERAGQIARPTAPGQLTAASLRAQWPSPGISRATHLLAVVGEDVSRSISPAVHGAAQRSLGLDAVFVALSVQDFPRALAAMDSDRWIGLAVTAPHKRSALALATFADEVSRRAGASNTLVRSPTGWRAWNTDVDGVRGALRRACGDLESLRGKRALVLGAGGAARAALEVLRELGAALCLCARDAERAQRLAAEFSADALPIERRAQGPWDIVVQCTPSPDCGGEAWLPSSALARGACVVDAIYRPTLTPLLEVARSQGAGIGRGADWFAAQAARQFELFHGRAAPREVIEAEVQHALA